MFVLIMLGILAVWVLLPLIPAILMFRLVPGNAITLTGPLANLTLNASGAIAAYFAVLVATTFFVLDIKQKASPVPRQYWTVIGKIELEDANGKPERFQRHVGKIKVITNPEVYEIDNNTADLRIKVVEGEGGLPSIKVAVDQFGLGVIKIAKGAPEFEFSHDENIIRLKNPLRVQQDPDNIPKVDRETANNTPKIDRETANGVWPGARSMESPDEPSW